MKLLCALVILNVLTIISTKHHRHNGHSTRRIAGGTEASIEDFPYMASFIRTFTENGQRRQQLVCSAVIIDRYFALSEERCLEGLERKDVVNGKAFIRGNSAWWSGAQVGSMQHPIVNYHEHRNYPDRRSSMPSLGLYYASVVIFKVKTPFTGVNEKPIPLAPKDYVYRPRSEATIVGWGVTREHPYGVAPKLRSATVRITDYERCKTFMLLVSETILQDDNMVCTFSRRKSLCLYDSGGPLVQNGFLIAIAGEADSRQCVDLDYFPNVYTRISEVNDWIVKYMKIL